MYEIFAQPLSGPPNHLLIKNYCNYCYDEVCKWLLFLSSFIQNQTSMCFIQREVGTVSQHGGRAYIFNVSVPYVGKKTGNEELITMLVCRDTASMVVLTVLFCSGRKTAT